MLAESKLSPGACAHLYWAAFPVNGVLVLIVDFPVEPSLLLDRNPRWRSHLLSWVEADPLVGFAWSAWSSCYYSGASLGFLVEIPLLLIVFFGSTGGRRSLLLGFGLQSCKPILISIFAGWLLRGIFELFIPTVVNYCCYLVWVCAYARFVCCDWLAREINLYYYSREYNYVLELVAIGWDFICLARVLIQIILIIDSCTVKDWANLWTA